MPTSRETAEGLTDELSGLYRALERELAMGIAKRLSSGIESEAWRSEKLAAAGEVRRWITNTVRRTTGRAGKLAQGAISYAFERGAGEAQRELAGRRARRNVASVNQHLPGAQSINRLATALAGQLHGTELSIVRSAADAYQRAVATPTGLVLGGALTRRQAAERAWNSLLDQGFTGFTDRAGRRWTASGYVEMATRTATAQAAVQGHLDRMAELGLDLVIVSNAAQECRLCRPWEGKVLTRTGPDGARTIEAESELTGDLVKVSVAGSVAEAIRAGLMHPNCRHSLSTYLPGITKAPTNTADPAGDKARQHLRYLERQQRHQRLREAGAMTPEARAAAAAKIKARSAEIKAHVEANDLTRRRDREQIDLGNKRTTQSDIPSSEIANPLQDALDSGIRSERQLGGGSMARVDKVTTNDGTELVRKLAKDSSGRPAVDQQDAEELGAAIMRAIGARAPEVLRSARDEIYSNYLHGEPLDPDEALQGALLGQAQEDARSLALADVLMGNTDRNIGNVIMANGKPWGIDHGAAFDFHPEHNPAGGVPIFRNMFRELVIDTVAKPARYKPLRAGEALLLREALEALKPEFERLGRRGWYRDMLRRLKALEGA